jgi:hypothetical protein
MLKFSTEQEMEINFAETEEVLQRGRMYERCHEKREGKLRDEWLVRMEDKKAEMQVMWDSLEKAKISSSHQQISRLSGVQSDSHTRQKVDLHHFFQFNPNIIQHAC